jgi:hypothetical protein
MEAVYFSEMSNFTELHGATSQKVVLSCNNMCKNDMHSGNILIQTKSHQDYDFHSCNTLPNISEGHTAIILRTEEKGKGSGNLNCMLCLFLLVLAWLFIYPDNGGNMLL